MLRCQPEGVIHRYPLGLPPCLAPKIQRSKCPFTLDGTLANSFHDRTQRPDGSLLAVYARHSNEKIHFYRISSPTNYLQWGPERKFIHNYPEAGNVTYMNLHAMESEEKLYNFFRGIGFNPSFITSTNHGATWGEPTHFIADEVEGRQRPYARYVQRDANTVGVSFTEAHPRDFGNSIYYADFRGGAFYHVDGRKIKDLTAGPLRPSEADRIFVGSGIKTNRQHSLS
ncbi:MAG: BNR-4 repeat-containing protein, partial [bacterium]